MKYRIYWTMTQYGTSEVEADSKKEAEEIAEKNTEDFGDPNQFIQEFNTDDCWKINKIEEIK